MSNTTPVIDKTQQDNFNELNKIANQLKSFGDSYETMSLDARQALADAYSRFSNLARELNIDNADKMLSSSIQQNCQRAFEDAQKGRLTTSESSTTLSYNDIQQHYYQQQVIYQQQIEAIVMSNGIDGAIEAYKKGLIKSLNHIPVSKIQEANDIQNLIKNGYDVDAPDLEGKILSQEMPKRIQQSRQTYEAEFQKGVEIDAATKEKMVKQFRGFIAVFNNADPQEREKLVQKLLEKRPELKDFFIKNMGATIDKDGKVHLSDQAKTQFISDVTISNLDDNKMASVQFSSQKGDVKISYTDRKGKTHKHTLTPQEQEGYITEYNNHKANHANGICEAHDTRQKGCKDCDQQDKKTKESEQRLKKDVKAGKVVIKSSKNPQAKSKLDKALNDARQVLNQLSDATESKEVKPLNDMVKQSDSHKPTLTNSLRIAGQEITKEQTLNDKPVLNAQNITDEKANQQINPQQKTY